MRHPLATLALLFSVSVLQAAPAPPEEPLRLLVVSKRDGKADIFVVNADGSGRKRLTDGKSLNAYPAWSRDRRKIAFASDRDGGMNIYVMDVDGSNVKRLTKENGFSRVPSWSPDGKQIAFCRTIRGRAYIFVMDADGSNEKQTRPRRTATIRAGRPTARKSSSRRCAMAAAVSMSSSWMRTDRIPRS